MSDKHIPEQNQRSLQINSVPEPSNKPVKTDFYSQLLNRHEARKKEKDISNSSQNQANQKAPEKNP